MNGNASNLWLWVLVASVATLAACADQNQSATGPGTVLPDVHPTTGGSAPSGATPAWNVSGNPAPFSPGKLKFVEAVGKPAPDFSLESMGGGIIKLSAYRGKNVVLFFTEGTMCYPACWDQMAQFGSDDRFNNKDTVVLSIGVNPKSEWESIVAKAPQLAKAPILLDTTKAVSSAYDVLSLKSSMHPGTLPGHTYFIIDREGIIRFAFDDVDMGIRNDKLAEELKKLAP